jgi:hypothetical protein
MPSEQNWLRRRGSKFFAPPSSMMISQKVPGWLSKNFDMPGVVYFCDRGHTCGYAEGAKMRHDAEDRTFCDAIIY